MKLNYQQYSEQGKPLLILHGLFGSLKNWNRHAAQLAETFKVFSLDLRNHGGSPHADTMTYSEMADDVLEFLDDHAIDEANIIGHSMGGKVAMQLALSHPERIEKLVVVDIAPVSYPVGKGGHDEVFQGLAAIDPARLKSRAEADVILAEFVPETPVRQFLLSNLQKHESGYRWKFYLPALQACYDELRQNVVATDSFSKPVLFVKGALSNYIREEDREAVLALFPNAQIKVVMEAGHWVHAEKPELFFRIVAGYFSDS